MIEAFCFASVFFFRSAEHIFFLFFYIYFLQRQLPRALSNGWIHTSRAAMDNGSRERAGTASRNHLLPDSFHLFIFMSLFLFFVFFVFFLSVRRAGVGTSASSQQVHCLTSTRWVVLIGLGTLATTPFNAQLIDPLFGVTGGTVSDKNWNKS